MITDSKLIIPFKYVGVGERFTFVNSYASCCYSGTKISTRKYVINDSGMVCTIGTIACTCEVDNSCACVYPVQLTFNDLSIGTIFQFGSEWDIARKNIYNYCKLDNMHYINFLDNRVSTINYAQLVVCTPEYVRSAQ